jgi:hypothetical protein
MNARHPAQKYKGVPSIRWIAKRVAAKMAAPAKGIRSGKGSRMAKA